MNIYQVESSKIINAPAEQVYALIADYHEGHPAILPSRYFSDLEVTKGGQGAGTMITVTMHVFGAKALFTMIVSEPEPGRVLMERDDQAGVVTTFTVDPLADGRQSRVTIRTEAKTRPGFQGWVEKWLNPIITRRIYREELDQLATIVQNLNHVEY